MSFAIDLSGKSAIVTGSAAGIGFEITRSLTECGASVAIVDVDEAALEAAAERESGKGIWKDRFSL